MKYKDLIIKKFNKYKLIPRPGQLNTVNSILLQYVDEKINNVVLSGSTGSGKSIIAVITSECLYDLLDNEQQKDYAKALTTF